MADLYEHYPSYLDEYMGNGGGTVANTRQMYSNDLPPEYFNAFGFTAFPNPPSSPYSSFNTSILNTIGGFLSNSLSILFSPISNLASTLSTISYTSSSEKENRSTTATSISNRTNSPRPVESITIPSPPKQHKSNSPSNSSTNNTQSNSNNNSTNTRNKSPQSSPQSHTDKNNTKVSSSSSSHMSNDDTAYDHDTSSVPIISSASPNFDLDYAMYGNSGFDSYGISTSATTSNMNSSSSAVANSIATDSKSVKEKIQYTSNPLAKKQASNLTETQREGSIIEYISNPMFREPGGNLGGASNSGSGFKGKSLDSLSGMRSYMREQEKMSGYKSKRKLMGLNIT